MFLWVIFTTDTTAIAISYKSKIVTELAGDIIAYKFFYSYEYTISIQIEIKLLFVKLEIYEHVFGKPEIFPVEFIFDAGIGQKQIM